MNVDEIHSYKITRNCSRYGYLIKNFMVWGAWNAGGTNAILFGK